MENLLRGKIERTAFPAGGVSNSAQIFHRASQFACRNHPGWKKAVALREATVALTVENDVGFHLIFPAPAAAAPLRIRAPFPKTLPPDASGAMLTACSTSGALPGQQLFTLEEPACELTPP